MTFTITITQLYGQEYNNVTNVAGKLNKNSNSMTLDPPKTEITFDPNQTSEGTISCPTSRGIIGGAYLENDSNGKYIQIFESHPIGTQSWSVGIAIVE